MAIDDLFHPLLGAYQRSPQWVRNTIGRAYSVLPEWVRYGQSINRFRTNVAACYDIENLQAAVDIRLRQTLQVALERVPAYQAYRPLLKQDLGPRELLMRLPLTSKLDIKTQLTSYVSTAAKASDRLKMFTGGSIATPMCFYAHKHVTRPKENAFFEDFDRRAGWRPGDVVLSLKGRSVPGAGEPGKPLGVYEPIKRHLILCSDHLEHRFMPQYVEALRKWQPTFIHAYPSALYPLARWLEAEPAPDIVERVRGIVLTSEPAYPYQLELYRRVFRCSVTAGYGHTERALLASTMPDDDRFFFWPLYGHLELVDDRGNAITRPGVLGEIVGTTFDNEVMPLVRYRTGDFGAWGDRPHPKLADWPVLGRIEGRLQEFVVCYDKRLISLNSLSATHFPALSKIDAMQYEQLEPGKVTVHVVTREPLLPTEREAIELAMANKAQGGCSFRVVRVPTIERTCRGKHRMMLQRLDLSPFLAASYVEALHGTANRASAATPAS